MYLWTTAVVSRHSSHIVRDFLPSEHSTAVAPSLFSSHPCHPTAYFQRNSQSLPCENITQILSRFKFLKMLPSHSLWAEVQVPTLKFKVLPDSLPLTSLNSLLGKKKLNPIFLKLFSMWQSLLELAFNFLPWYMLVQLCLGRFKKRPEILEKQHAEKPYGYMSNLKVILVMISHSA